MALLNFSNFCGRENPLGLSLILVSSLLTERLLVPKCVLLKSRGSRGRVRFQDAFCGAYFTFAISREGHVYGFGLSNYHQLGEYWP